MESLLNRYRNLTVLLLVISAQLLLIAYQVKSNKDVPLIRVWAITAVTPVERALEAVRRNTWGFVEYYFVLLHTRGDNDRLRKELGTLKLENQYLKTELSTADRARALSAFQARSPSKTLAARIIGNGTGANSKLVFIDRGSGSGVQAGMAVVTPDGIVGKVVSAYPTASQVLLITDANFAAGVISQKNRVRGTLKGQGHDGTVRVEYIQNEEKVDTAEWFFTSGDDRVFPKGFPVGQVTAVRNGRTEKEIYLAPTGFQGGLEEVLIVLDAVHQEIPEDNVAVGGYRLLSSPPETGAPGAATQANAVNTDADKLKEAYREVGAAEKHTFGEGLPGSIPPDFTHLGVTKTSPPSGIPASTGPVGSTGATGSAAAAILTPKASGSTGTTGSTARAVPAVRPAGSLATTGSIGMRSTGSGVLAPPNTAAVSSVPQTRPRPPLSGPLLVTDPADVDSADAPPPAKPVGATTKPAATKPPGDGNIRQ